ncbi:DUF5305 family protein [Pseudobacteroides cellulosolvens]|uniref:Uncharacterized protein n=1 Tax=Pseudobacteroides cellulosolvens ATCC 35603 = DSM 2933 TaxID=398512 RepID=A0A0L6JII9_9FIRM|nr:DUF5305 family protein [Pseudobacteroides cellulosolvens]KNY25545.1 hypothetical protein Bccel_0805 [Pseudobacteroides cellulosolvens ATCC 35603 = DSM 2933]
MAMELSKPIKLRLIIIFLGFSIFSSTLLVYSLLQRKTVEITEKKDVGNHKGIISYDVNLKPNPIYNSEIPNSGEKYITGMIENINMNFDYNFTGNTGGDVAVDYSISATIEAYEQNGEKERLWSKSYLLEPKVREKSKGNISINRKLILELEKYNSFVKNVLEEYKINSKANLIINFNISVEAHDSVNGIYRNSIAPNLIIPLSEDYFVITGDKEIKENCIIENIKPVVIIKSNQVIFFSIIVGICVLGLFILFLYVRGKETSEQNKKVQYILRKYNMRIVNICDERYLTLDNSIRVHSFDDLLKASDELGKPILYNILDNDKSSNFFILSENKNFICTVTDCN